MLLLNGKAGGTTSFGTRGRIVPAPRGGKVRPRGVAKRYQSDRRTRRR